MKKLRLLTLLSFIICCLAFFVGCGKSVLSTPDIQTFSVDVETLTLTWDGDQNAKGYKILVNEDEYNLIVNAIKRINLKQRC